MEWKWNEMDQMEWNGMEWNGMNDLEWKEQIPELSCEEQHVWRKPSRWTAPRRRSSMNQRQIAEMEAAQSSVAGPRRHAIAAGMAVEGAHRVKAAHKWDAVDQVELKRHATDWRMSIIGSAKCRMPGQAVIQLRHRNQIWKARAARWIGAVRTGGWSDWLAAGSIAMVAAGLTARSASSPMMPNSPCL